MYGVTEPILGLCRLSKAVSNVCAVRESPSLRVFADELLTLGAHAPEGYGSCPVCVSVRNLNLGTGASRGLNEGTSE